jgi:hypothetical protein
MGGAARALSLQAGRRIRENFEYAAAARMLRGHVPAVSRQGVSGRLPGLYRSRE